MSERARWLAERILASAKYRHLDPGFVGRVAAEADQRFRDRGQALKYAKRKLHQAFGAFATADPAGAVTAVVAAVRAGRSDLRTAAAAAMRAHASSAERVEWLEPFYRQVADWCGEPATVLDLACGLNPLAIPWMRLPPEADYRCCEVDTALVASLAQLDQVMPVRLSSFACDLTGSPPPVSADLGLLLKTAATLEQQRAGATAALLARLRCRQLVISLARRSLSGRRGYQAQSTELVREAAAGSRYQLRAEAEVGDEVLFHLTSVEADAS